MAGGTRLPMPWHSTSAPCEYPSPTKRNPRGCASPMDSDYKALQFYPVLQAHTHVYTKFQQDTLPSEFHSQELVHQTNEFSRCVFRIMNCGFVSNCFSLKGKLCASPRSNHKPSAGPVVSASAEARAASNGAQRMSKAYLATTGGW